MGIRVGQSARRGCPRLLHLGPGGTPGDPRRGPGDLASPAEPEHSGRPRSRTWRAQKGRSGTEVCGMYPPPSGLKKKKKALLVTECLRNQHLQCTDKEKKSPGIITLTCPLHFFKKIKCYLFLSCCLKALPPNNFTESS